MQPPNPDHPGVPPKVDQLLATVRSGYQALGQLLELHRRYLLTIANEEIDPELRASCGASDIVQDACLNVLKNLDHNTEGLIAVSNQEDLRRWLRRVVLNALHKRERYETQGIRDIRQTRPLQDQVSGDPSPSSVCGRSERDGAVEKATNVLQEADRMLLRLREVHNWSYGDLATLLDGQWTEAGRVRMQRRLAELRFRLSGDEILKPFGS